MIGQSSDYRNPTLVLQYDDGMWIASDDYTLMYGVGDTIPLAMDDYRVSLAESWWIEAVRGLDVIVGQVVHEWPRDLP